MGDIDNQQSDFAGSVQVGGFNAGTIGSSGYSLDPAQFVGNEPAGATFDLLIQYGDVSVHTEQHSGFATHNGGFLNLDHTASGVVIGEHGIFGDQSGWMVDGVYATFCAQNGGCGSRGKDFWNFSINGVYPSSAANVPCGFYYNDGWDTCPSGDNAQRMRYYIRW